MIRLNMHKLLVLICIFSFLYASNRHTFELSHLITLQQLKEALDGEEGDEKTVSEVLRYTEDDIDHLKKQNNINYIIGAAYQLGAATKNYKQKFLTLLKQYIHLVEVTPIGLSLLLSRALREDDLARDLDLEYLTDKLISLDSKNGYPYYFKAYYFSTIKNADKCLLYMAKANSQEIFNNYYTELSNISIMTSLFLGYAKTVAQIHALGQQHDIGIFLGLSKYLNGKIKKPECLNESVKMGMALKKSSRTILNDLLSYAVLLQAYAKMKGKEEELRAVEHERDDAFKMLYTLDTFYEKHDVSEKRIVEYYEDLYSTSETYAVRKLLQEYPVDDLKWRVYADTCVGLGSS